MATIQDLTNLINLTGGIGGVSSSTRQQQQAVQGDIFDNFLTKINNTFDNELIQRELGRIESYVTQNEGDMSDAMWDKYSYIKETATYNMEDNNYFNVYSEKIDSSAKEFWTLMDSYNEAVVEDKSDIIKNLQGRIIDFVNDKNIMKRKYGTRLSRPEYHTERLKLAQYDDVFQFGVASLIDDGELSRDEGTAFFNSIVAGEATPMQNYIIKETNHRNAMAQVSYNEGMDIIDGVNYWGELLDAQKTVLDVRGRIDSFENILINREFNEQEALDYEKAQTEWNLIKGKTAWTDIREKDNPIPHTYEHVFTGVSSKVLTEARAQMSDLEKKLQTRELGYKNMTGQSLYDSNIITYPDFNYTPPESSSLIEGGIKVNVSDLQDNNKKRSQTKPGDLNIANAPQEDVKLIKEYQTDKKIYDEAMAWLDANPETAFEPVILFNLRNKYNEIRNDYKKKYYNKNQKSKVGVSPTVKKKAKRADPTNIQYGLAAQAYIDPDEPATEWITKEQQIQELIKKYTQ